MFYNNFDVKYYSEYELNLKEIEKVDIAKSSEVYFLNMTTYNSKKRIKCKINSYFDAVKRSENNEYRSTIGIPAINDKKLVQAFNHLRKLCGAPEPLKF